MIKPDYNILTNLSDSIKASDSASVWKEFLIVNHNLVNYISNRVKEDEAAELLKSLQTWVTKRELKEYREFESSSRRWVEKEIQLGDIIFIDLGVNFINEASYAHPAVVIEKVKDSILIVPCSSSSDKIAEAFHPIHNNTESSNKSMYRKVTPQNGFESVCVLEFDKIKVINKARIIKILGHLNEDINQSNSLFNEIKKRVFQLYLPKQYISFIKLLKENRALNERISELEEEIKNQKDD